MMKNFSFGTNRVVFAKRLTAQIIDLALVFVTVMVLFVWFKSIGPVFIWAILLVYFSYCVLMDAYRDGTVGKHYLGLKVIKSGGASMEFRTALYRNLMKFVLLVFWYEIFLLIFVKDYPGLHNNLSKTNVVLK